MEQTYSELNQDFFLSGRFQKGGDDKAKEN